MKIKEQSVCPICNKFAEKPHMPFCSARCKLIDLGNWIDGGYRLRSEEVPSEGEIIDITARIGQKNEFNYD